MRFQVVTIFPEMFAGFLGAGVIGRAIERGLLRVDTVCLRDFAQDAHRTVDDRPYGGGAGMVLKPDVLSDAIAHCRAASPGARVVFLTPQGRTLDHRMVCDLRACPSLVLVSGRYQGIDQRAIDEHADLEVSIGDYVLSGGEVAAMAVIDAVARLVDGVVGKEESVRSDSFAEGLLAPPVYTRPEVWNGRRVPQVLLGGDHGKIAQWRHDEAVRATARKRPDLAGAVTRRLPPESC